MSEELVDDQSHYEVSLTAGQAFLAFMLLLLSLAASFAFGLLIGRGQNDDRLTARKEPVVVNEASLMPRKAVAREVPVAKNEDFKEPEIKEEALSRVAPPTSAASAAEVRAATPAIPHFVQLLSTSDQKTAEALAAKLIDGGFTSAYVERGTTEKGTVFRVRVKFPSEPEARAAVTKLSQFSKDVWITK